MAIETRERQIGGTLYRVTQLPARPGRALLVRYLKLIGPGAGSLVGGVGRSGASTFDLALGVGIGDAIHDFCERLNDAELGTICDEFARYTVIVQSRDVQIRLSDVFDDHFAAKYDEMLKWLRFCSEVNFASFFAVAAAGRGALLRTVAQAAASGWPSPRTSTGTSNASQPAAATPTG